MAWKIIEVTDKALKGKYYGMNYYANKELKEKIPMGKNDILVSKNLGEKMKKRTIAHEKLEAQMMRDRGMKYNKAHKCAEAMDDYVK
jgi:hypothetical protein